jgi:hypothetical protein
MLVMVLGDLHGDTRAGLSAIREAHALGVQHIIQVGDFGYWPHFTDGVTFLDDLEWALEDTGIMLHWLDGNHENFDAIEAAVKNYPNDGMGRVWIRTHIRYCSRGANWKWDGKRFMTVGGAVSIDKKRRLNDEAGHRGRGARTLWWPQEQLTEGELFLASRRAEQLAQRGEPVDYLFTHDCPTNAPFKGRLKPDEDSHAHRQKMDRLGKVVKPKVWFHGHMHTQYDGYQFPPYESTTTVYGLECNPQGMRGYGVGNYWGILDTETDTFTYKNDLPVK